MKKTKLRITSLLMAMLMMVGMLVPVVYADETETDDQVAAVIAQLEAIDTLQQMQNKRNSFTASNHYDSTTTDAAIIATHEAARTGYETYVSEMFAARIAAQKAYDALSAAQKAQIDAGLVAKLDNNLSTTFKTGTYSVTPTNDEYTFEAVQGELGLVYEVGNYMVAGNIPQIFILVDTANGETSWTPNGRYTYGSSNYNLAYCCDIQNGLEYTTDYKRMNLEDSQYYGESSAKHIRAILENSYPFVTLEQMKASLKANGMNAEFVDSLSRADVISAVQLAIWVYSNVKENEGALGYFASVDVPKNTGIYFTPLHDYTTELWEWLPGKRQRSFDARAEYRVNTLAYYLCNLPGKEASEGQIIISDVAVTRADLVPGENGIYNVGMYIQLNHSGNAQDNLRVQVTSFDANGVETGHSDQPVGKGVSRLQMNVNAKIGDTIQVVLEGTQYLERSVYFYYPKGGRDISQSLVGVAEGSTRVRAEESFVFTEESGEMGLRIYKTASDTGAPISDITFSIYGVNPTDGEYPEETPTEAEIAQYATAANKVGSVVTDTTGYGSIALKEGLYLIVEEHNTEKVVAPLTPFYIYIPMNQTVEHEDGTITIEKVNIVSIYPKNEPTKPPEEPPVVPPPPNNVTGSFEILKHDANDKTIVLKGAEFAVYRAATTEDTNVEVITCEGVQYAVVPVLVGGTPLVLKTGADGKAASPELPCGIYYLVETDAPAGYNLLDEAVSVVVVSNMMETVKTTEIANRRGNILPETGATGTKWLIIIGSTIMVSAAVLLITKKRMSIYE